MDYLLKASAVIALFYFCFYFFLKKETFFNHNRWFLLIGVGIALLFPLVVIPIHITIEPQVFTETAFVISDNSSTPLQTATPEPIFKWEKLVSILYGVGLIVFLIQFLFQFGSLIVLLLKNKKNKAGRYTYVIVNSTISPFSFFKWIVYNPEAFDQTELQMMLTHEKVHANQLHSIDILFTHLTCAIFWFNPLMWLYKREVKQNLEYIADFKTQARSQNEQTYQRLLLKTAVPHQNISLSNNFYNSLIKERIIMLTKSRSERKNQFKYLLILPLLAGLLMSTNTEEIYVESESKLEAATQPNSLTNDIKRTDSIQTIESNYNLIEVIFTKEMTDIDLDEIKELLKSHDITMTLKSVKRNAKGEIKAIHINFETKNGSTNYSVKDSDGIEPFYFKLSSDGSFGVGAKKDKTIIIVEETGKNSVKTDPNNTSDREIIEIIEVVEDTIHRHHVNGKAKLHHKDSVSAKYTYKVVGAYASKNKDSLFINRTLEIDSTEVVNDLSSRVKRAYYLDDNLPFNFTNQSIVIHEAGITENTILKLYKDLGNPVYIMNGKSIHTDDILSIKPNQIESLTVLKGKTALQGYGEMGKNGVIIIKNKDANSPKMKKTKALAKNPWEIRTEITSTSYIDDEDPSKNGTLVYITKYASETTLNNHIAYLKSFGISVKYSRIKRNKDGHITSIKISLKNEKGSQSSATWKSNTGIPGIEFGETEGSLIARTSHMN